MAAKKKEDLMRGPKLDEKPKLKKTPLYGGKGEYTLAKEMMAAQKKKKATSYSPAPMTAAAKKKAAAAGKKTAEKVKNPMGLKQMNLDKMAKAKKK